MSTLCLPYSKCICNTLEPIPGAQEWLIWADIDLICVYYNILYIYIYMYVCVYIYIYMMQPPRSPPLPRQWVWVYRSYVPRPPPVGGWGGV